MSIMINNILIIYIRSRNIIKLNKNYLILFSDIRTIDSRQ